MAAVLPGIKAVYKIGSASCFCLLSEGEKKAFLDLLPKGSTSLSVARIGPDLIPTSRDSCTSEVRIRLVMILALGLITLPS